MILSIILVTMALYNIIIDRMVQVLLSIGVATVLLTIAYEYELSKLEEK